VATASKSLRRTQRVSQRSSTQNVSAVDQREDKKAFVRFTGLIALLMLAWIVMTPMAGGPDEQHHLVRSAAVVRGQVTATAPVEGAVPEYRLPAWLAIDVDCFKLQPDVPASCAPALIDSETRIGIVSTAREYPIWGHILPGLPSLVTSGSSAVYLARILDAAIPVLLMGAALTIARRSRLQLAGILMALTPMAWFSIAVVNPSGLVLAGALGIWVGLIWERQHQWAPWLMAAGWAAAILPRRDGIIWVAAILMVFVIHQRVSLKDWFLGLARGPQIVMGVSTLLALGGAALSGNRISLTGLVVPVVVAVIELARWLWVRAEESDAVTGIRIAIGALMVVGSVAGAVVVFLVRPGGPDTHLASRIFGQTGLNIVEAIGVLGWLDAPVPLTMVMLYLLGIGALVTLTILCKDHRTLVTVGAILAVAIAASWVLELYSGNVTSTYWQGRYYLGLLMGIPLLLARVPGAHAAKFHGLNLMPIAAVLGGISLYLLNGAFWATGRRFGVGINGSLKPWTWDTYGSALAPGDAGLGVLVLAGALGFQLWRRSHATV
jgi:hypothetical protein